MIKAVASQFPSLSLDESAWRRFREFYGATTIIFSDASIDRSSAMAALEQNHHSGIFRGFDWHEFSEDKDAAFSKILGREEFLQSKAIVTSLLSESEPVPQSANGVFILVKEQGLGFPPHNHTFDVLFRSGPQKAIWWNSVGVLPEFWFESEAPSLEPWPIEELCRTNAYILDTKRVHAGAAAPALTVFFISFARIFSS